MAKLILLGPYARPVENERWLADCSHRSQFSLDLEASDFRDPVEINRRNSLKWQELPSAGIRPKRRGRGAEEW
jgi:hypothetical protein